MARPWLLAVTIIPVWCSWPTSGAMSQVPVPGHSLDQVEEARKGVDEAEEYDDEMVDKELEEMKAEKEAEQEPEMSILELLSSSKLRQATGSSAWVMHLKASSFRAWWPSLLCCQLFESAGISRLAR